jgi:hypothetical protein
VELQLNFAVEIDAGGVALAVTHWVPRSFRQKVIGNAGLPEENAQTPCRNDRVIWEIQANAAYYCNARDTQVQGQFFYVLPLAGPTRGGGERGECYGRGCRSAPRGRRCSHGMAKRSIVSASNSRAASSWQAMPPAP